MILLPPNIDVHFIFYVKKTLVDPTEMTFPESLNKVFKYTPGVQKILYSFVFLLSFPRCFSDVTDST